MNCRFIFVLNCIQFYCYSEKGFLFGQVLKFFPENCFLNLGYFAFSQIYFDFILERCGVRNRLM